MQVLELATTCCWSLIRKICTFQIVLTSIVLKANITMLDIVSTRMLGQYVFLAKVHFNAYSFLMFILGILFIFSSNLFSNHFSRFFLYLEIWGYLLIVCLL